jgi:peptidoglycan/LPS O-acetylase OafA/YrhL
MCSTVLIGALLFAEPFSGQKIASYSAIGSILFSANVVIAKITKGYFAAPAQINPLLNVWSLSVEEQFYLVFPLILFIGFSVHKKCKKFSSFFLVFTLGLISLFCMFIDSIGKAQNPPLTYILGFYSPLERLWEFVAGALFAYIVFTRSKFPQLWNKIFSVLGITGIAFSAFFINSGDTFPSLLTLIPVAGTCLLLISGGDSGVVVSKILSIPILVKIGSYSYSIYLWHWPCICFGTYLFPNISGIKIFSGLFSFIPAYFCWRFWEQHFRYVRPSRPLVNILRISIFTLTPLVLAFSLLALSSILGANYIKKFGPPAKILANQDLNSARCFPKYFEAIAPVASGEIQCQQSKAMMMPQIALLGDSHAQMLYASLSKLSPRKNIAYYIQYDAILRYKDANALFRKSVNAVAITPSINVVILNFWYDQKGAPIDELSAILKKLSSPGRSIFILDDVPDFPFSSYECQYPKSLLVQSFNCVEPYSSFYERYYVYFQNLKKVTEKFPGVYLIHSAKYFCTSRLCDMRHSGNLLYADAGHLNEQGANFLLENVISHNPTFKNAILD